MFCMICMITYTCKEFKLSLHDRNRLNFFFNLSRISHNFLIWKCSSDKEKFCNSEVSLILKTVISLYHPFIEWIVYIMEKLYINTEVRCLDCEAHFLHTVRIWAYELSCGETEHGGLKFQIVNPPPPKKRTRDKKDTQAHQ